jgi:hypothetical protein
MAASLPAAVAVALALSALSMSSAFGQDRVSLWAPASPAPIDGRPGAAKAEWAPGPPDMGWTQPLVIPGRRPQAGPPSVAAATALSAVLPGAGQHLLGQRRKWAYLAIEGLAWALWIDRRAVAGDFRDRYRDFAWNEARIRSTPRVDGDFEYYETLSKWQRSGAFDADVDAAGVQPEADPMTFNGSIWALAARIYLPEGSTTPVNDLQYQRALAYYQERAYGIEFLWDWTGTADARQTYSDLIGESDRHFQQATNVLGILIANHVVSAVDAFLTARGLAVPGEARVVPTIGGRGTGWTATVRLALPR